MDASPPVALALIAALGVGAQWFARSLRLPSILVLLVAGVLAGPVTGLLEPDDLLGRLLFPLVSLGVAVILFEGGLSLGREELSAAGSAVRRLLTVGAAATWAGSALAARLLLDLDLAVAVLLGAILVVTGPTVVTPLLEQIRPKGRISAVLRTEGVLVDPLGASLAVLVFEAVVGDTSQTTSEIGWSIGRTLLTGVVLGGAGAAVLFVILARFIAPDDLWPGITLSLVLAAAVAANEVQDEAGLLAATVMGVVLAWQRRVPTRQLVEFGGQLRALLIGSLFIVLAARLELDSLGDLGWRGPVFVVALIVLGRPLAVALSTPGTGLTRAERLFLAVMAPRGIVAAATASVLSLALVEAGQEDAELLVPATFMVIVGTILVYGVVAPFAADRLGLTDRDPQGVLVIGAHPWARRLAEGIERLGFRAVLVDQDRQKATAGRMEGRPTLHASALADETMRTLDLEGVGRLLALTSNDELNALAAQQFAAVFGRREVYQVAPSRSGGAQYEPLASHQAARVLWRDDLTFGRLDELFDAGARLHSTRITEQFGTEDLRAEHGDVVLMFVANNGRLRVVTADSDPELRPGDRVLVLVPHGAPGRDPDAAGDE